MKHIVLNIQTQKTYSEIADGNRPWLLKMSTAVTYEFNNDSYKFWTYINQKDLIEYLNKNTVIGFNSMTFESPILLGEKHKLDVNGNSTNGEYSWINYDILIEIRKRLYRTLNKPVKETFDAHKKNFSPNQKGVYSLNGITSATIGKWNDKIDCVELYKQKKIIELFNFNLNVTRNIKQLYDFIKKYKYIINGNFDIIKF